MDNNTEIKNVVNVNLDSKDLDLAIEKVSQLKNLLLEVKEVINSLNGLGLFK